MTVLTKEIEDKIRELGQALKLQLDFTASADMTKQEDLLQLMQNNMKAGNLLIDLVRTLRINFTDDATVLEEIAAFTTSNGSNAGDLLKAQAVKVRAINSDVAALAKAQNGKVTPADINRIFRKNINP